MRFIRSVIAQDETPASDGTITYDLPVNPLSYLNFTIKALNVTNEATLGEILALVSNISVLHLGQSIINMSAADLYAYNVLLLGKVPVFTNLVVTDNATRSVGLLIPLGRKIMDPTECFPATKKGEFQLQATVDIANVGADGLILQIETTELLAATPRNYLKATTLTATPSATGNMDVDLPIGNKLVALLLFSSTVPTGTVWTTTIDQARIMANNQEEGYANANWESMHADMRPRLSMPLGSTDSWAMDAVENYALMNYDPLIDDNFLLDTAPLSSLAVRINAGDTGVLRVIPLELISV